MSWIKELFFERPSQWIHERLPELCYPDQSKMRPLKKNEEYIWIKMKSTRIPYSRKGFNTYYGVVHSYISLLHRSGKNASFHSVSTPGNLELLDSKRMGNVINIDKVILGPIPYLGHLVDMEIGLLSVPADNLAKPFVQLLSEISDIAGVSVVNNASLFSAPIESGIRLLTSAQTTPTLEIGLSKSYSEIFTGYYVAIAANKGSIDINSIKIDNDFGITVNNKALDEYAYFVFEISGTKERDDWFTIPYIAAAYEKLDNAIKKPDVLLAEELLMNLRLILYQSPDLLKQDAEEIYKQMKLNTDNVLKIIKGKKSRSEEGGNIMLKNLSEYKIY